ncbi:hypothetical protein CHH49_16905 [Terribacillus saccharophilus]|uniref:hypothetical protein n=1 Tax=Terribacillus saccharophilus TaxID=361277 RepID=UPI000BA7E141|nr:hypothetical protein [Terribacillus saccharophilus]PAF20321.1 hypothetical protein CHH49_16905 [Terribacillus saccharophilus]
MTIKNMKSVDILNDEVKPKEILEYLENKYDTEEIVSQRTIKRWLNELGIECIQPKPKRNSDIRYSKADVLKLEETKKEDLLQKQHLSLWKIQKEKIVEKERKKMQDYYDHLSSMTEEERNSEDHLISYQLQADKIIKGEMLEMCFEKLFPNTTFDKTELAINLYNSDPNTINSNEVKGEAINYINKKQYKKTKKDIK